jgi:hypothetical protein
MQRVYQGTTAHRAVRCCLPADSSGSTCTLNYPLSETLRDAGLQGALHANPCSALTVKSLTDEKR